MKLEEVYAEIVEREPTFNSMQSVLRKINAVRRNLFRNYKQQEIVSALDALKGVAQYPLPCPKSIIRKVIVNGEEYAYHTEGIRPYYYFLKETIGLAPAPDQDNVEGIEIFHYEQINDFSIQDMEASPVFDEDYDMLVVYGVLKDIADGYDYKYNELLREFILANEESIPDYIPVV